MKDNLSPKYKNVKVLKPHCPVCKSQLYGNNSYVDPWKCLCGFWKFNQSTRNYEIVEEYNVKL